MWATPRMNASVIVSVFGLVQSTQPTRQPVAASYQAVSHGRTGLPVSSSTKQSNWWWSPNQTSFTVCGFSRTAMNMWSSFQAFTPRRASVTSSDGIAASIRDSVCLHSGTRIPTFTGSAQGG